jgi:pimeloyl-ACP methyl ester carboxylesterase
MNGGAGDGEGGFVWRAWVRRARALDARFDGLHRVQRFDYQQPLTLQRGAPRRLRRHYAVPVHYTEWGPADAPALVCVGGVVNTAARFSFLAADLARAGRRVLCMDWLGRGRSGWLADDHEYGLGAYVEQLRQFIAHLGGGPVALLGSSMGGTVAIELAARAPHLVSALALNDTGALIPRARRVRRAHTLARWYVFRSPAEIMRRVGAAQKNDGPVGEDVRHFLAWHQTRWSEADGGRVYRHDPRALLAYRHDAQHAVHQWDAWQRVRCPVLLLHGQQSDALSPATIERMRRVHALTLAHVPLTGHTPVLCDRHQTALVAAWLRGELPAPAELSIPLGTPRVRLSTLEIATIGRACA